MTEQAQPPFLPQVERPFQQFGTGRIYKPDEKDKLFLSEAFLDKHRLRKIRRNATQIWDLRQILDQGETSSCVGHAWCHWEYAKPLETFDGPGPFDIYNEAQLLDDIPGQEPDIQGTTVRAGAKYLSSKRRIETYTWARSESDVKRALQAIGPVVFGTTWYTHMFTPDINGFVTPTGENAGGHAYLCVGYDSQLNAYKFANSWGVDWGQAGFFWMEPKYVELLLRRNGEACAAIERTP